MNSWVEFFEELQRILFFRFRIGNNFAVKTSQNDNFWAFSAVEMKKFIFW